MARRGLVHGMVGLGSLCLLLGCSGTPATSSNGKPSAPGIAITVSATACGTGWRNPVPGLQTFQIHNTSSGPVEVSLTNAQTGGVYVEIEGVGPGTTRPMQVEVGSGTYAFLCDAAAGGQMTGPTTVVPGKVSGGTAVTPADVPDTLSAVAAERTYITTGLANAAHQVSRLEGDIAAGNLTEARSEWLTAHLTYERLGSAYGVFSGYDDEIDGSPDGLPGGVKDPSFTGFYRIEYGLWHGQSAAQLIGPTQLLYRDIQSLRTAFPGLMLYPQAALSDLALRTHEILEHAIRFQISGADDFGSGTTLATADANIEATQAQLSMLKPLLTSRYADSSPVYSWLDRLQRLIVAQHSRNGWIPVDKLSTTQREDINSAAAETVQLLAPIPVMFESSPLP
jgi:iron uptake system EfeUOB component EfeO/EfeM